MSDYEIPLTDLLEAGCHFGHQVRRWNPKMEPYIYTERDRVHIFDLAKTAEGIKEACEFIKELVSKGGELLMVGTKRQAKPIIKEEATKAGAPFVCERWLGGTITNWNQIKKSIEKLIDMREKREKGEYDKYTKKENILINREIDRLERFFGGFDQLKKIPEAMFIVDIQREKVAVDEALQRGVKVVALVDSNSDPEKVDYVIPANDDAVRSIKLVVSAVAQAYADGRRLAEKKK